MDPNQTSPVSPVTSPVQTPAAPVSPAFTPAPSVLSSIPELPHAPEKLLPAGHKTSWGALIGIVIILIVLVVGALYFWGAKLAEQEGMTLITEEEFSAEAEVEVPVLGDTTTDGFEAITEIVE